MDRWKFMFNHQFLAEFSQNFVEQVQRILNIDGYLIYSINNINAADNYHAFNIPKSSLNEYLDHKMDNDPVSFRNFYNRLDNRVELLNEHHCNDEYLDFMSRWKIQDTAEIFFRKRNGEPILGLSMMRESNNKAFTQQDKNILESFYCLSEKYFYHHADTIDKGMLVEKYNLTKKEIIILEQMLNGLENYYIAEKLNCSLATVKTHVQHIYQKTNIKNRQELLCRFLR